MGGTLANARTYPNDNTQYLPVYQFWHAFPNLSQLTKLGIYMASPFACTLEPMNKNPVTQTVINATTQLLFCRASVDWAGNGVPRAQHRTSNFRSDHRSGANFLYADGSVHFLNESIEMTTYRALSSIMGSDEPNQLPPGVEASTGNAVQ